jgi:hypothetical protein
MNEATVATAGGDEKPGDEVKRNDARITFNAFLEHEVKQAKQGGVTHTEGEILLPLLRERGVTISMVGELIDFINGNPELFFAPDILQCCDSWSMEQLWRKYLRHREREVALIPNRCLVAAFQEQSVLVAIGKKA